MRDDCQDGRLQLPIVLNLNGASPMQLHSIPKARPIINRKIIAC